MKRRSKGKDYLSPRDDGQQAVGCCKVVSTKPFKQCLAPCIKDENYCDKHIRRIFMRTNVRGQVIPGRYGDGKGPMVIV